MKIDAKSLLYGLILGIVAMLAVAATEGDRSGKYQVSGGAGFFVILDTESGQAWYANMAAPAPGVQGVQPGFWEKK